MKSYKDIRREIVGEHETANGVDMPCSHCRTVTAHLTLRNLGGMCHACFEHYCGDAFDDEGQAARYRLGLESSRVGRTAPKVSAPTGIGGMALGAVKRIA